MLTKIRQTLLIKAPRDSTPASIEAFCTALKHRLNSAPETVVLDCSTLEHVTSAHVNLLWRVYQECADAGVAVRISSPTAGLRRTLRLLDLHNFFLGPEDTALATLVKTQKLPIIRDFESYHDKFPPDSRSIDVALARFLEFIEHLSLPELVRFDLRVIFYEIATNIRYHSGMDPDDTIKFSATPEPTKIVLTFTDSGKPFDPTSYQSGPDPRQATRQSRTRGFGIRLVRSLTDNMRYVRQDQTYNVLTVEKKWYSENE